MGEFTDKISGAAKDIAGKVKEGIGAATDDHKLEAEGDAQQAEGKVDTLKGDVKGAISDL